MAGNANSGRRIPQEDITLEMRAYLRGYCDGLQGAVKMMQGVLGSADLKRMQTVVENFVADKREIKAVD